MSTTQSTSSTTAAQDITESKQSPTASTTSYASTTMKHYFITGLRKGISDKIITRGADTLSEAIQLAQEFESYESSPRPPTRNPHEGPRPIRATQPATSTATTDRCRSCPNANHERSKCPRVQCYKCSAWGHMANQCQRATAYTPIRAQLNQRQYQNHAAPR